MDYTVVENEIVAKLTADLNSNFLAEVMPENDGDYERPYEKPKVTVAYIGSKYIEPNRSNESYRTVGDAIVQNEILNFELVFWGKDVRSTYGLHALMRDARKILIGFMPTNCYKMYILSQNLSSGPEKQKDLFYYSAIFACESLVVENIEMPTGVPIAEATIAGVTAQ